MYYVSEIITVLISKKCLYLGLASLFCLIFCVVIFSNKQYLIDTDHFYLIVHTL